MNGFTRAFQKSEGIFLWLSSQTVLQYIQCKDVIHAWSGTALRCEMSALIMYMLKHIPETLYEQLYLKLITSPSLTGCPSVCMQLLGYLFEAALNYVLANNNTLGFKT